MNLFDASDYAPVDDSGNIDHGRATAMARALTVEFGTKMNCGSIAGPLFQDQMEISE